jgi:hypothetical protein
MKPVSTVLGGMVVLIVASAALAQAPVDQFPPRGEPQQTELHAWRQDPVRGQPSTRQADPAPRGDLRGDIASNARALTGQDRRDLAHPH